MEAWCCSFCEKRYIKYWKRLPKFGPSLSLALTLSLLQFSICQQRSPSPSVCRHRSPTPGRSSRSQAGRHRRHCSEPPPLQFPPHSVLYFVFLLGFTIAHSRIRHRHTRRLGCSAFLVISQFFGSSFVSSFLSAVTTTPSDSLLLGTMLTPTTTGENPAPESRCWRSFLRGKRFGLWR